MANRLLLHIGTQKSGTTYLQRVLAHLSGQLKGDGVLYPTRLQGRREIYNHEAAAYGLLGTAAFPWVPAAKAQAQTSAWDRLRRKVAEWEGTAIVSGEALSVIDDYYDDRSGEHGSVLTSLVMHLADPSPRDDVVTRELHRYKRLDERWHDWRAVVSACEALAMDLAEGRS